MRALCTALAVVLVLLGIVNSITCEVEEARLGGSALNGYAKDGHFFVSEHGVVTEVSQSDWEHNRVHSISELVSLVLFMLGLGYIFLQMWRLDTPYRGGLEAGRQLVLQLSRSPLLSEMRCGGKLGGFWSGGRGWWMHVFLHEAGLIIKPMLMPAYGIALSDIEEVTDRSSMFGRRTTISHKSNQLVSPLTLSYRGHSELCVLLRRRVRGGSGIEVSEPPDPSWGSESR
jgi:hypothetical protein